MRKTLGINIRPGKAKTTRNLSRPSLLPDELTVYRQSLPRGAGSGRLELLPPICIPSFLPTKDKLTCRLALLTAILVPAGPVALAARIRYRRFEVAGSIAPAALLAKLLAGAFAAEAWQGWPLEPASALATEAGAILVDWTDCVFGDHRRPPAIAVLSVLVAVTEKEPKKSH